MKLNRLSTMRVRYKRANEGPATDDGVVIINEKDFDPDVHTKARVKPSRKEDEEETT